MTLNFSFINALYCILVKSHYYYFEQLIISSSYCVFLINGSNVWLRQTSVFLLLFFRLEICEYMDFFFVYQLNGHLKRNCLLCSYIQSNLPIFIKLIMRFHGRIFVHEMDILYLYLSFYSILFGALIWYFININHDD